MIEKTVAKHNGVFAFARVLPWVSHEVSARWVRFTTTYGRSSQQFLHNCCFWLQTEVFTASPGTAVVGVEISDGFVTGIKCSASALPGRVGQTFQGSHPLSCAVAPFLQDLYDDLAKTCAYAHLDAKRQHESDPSGYQELATDENMAPLLSPSAAAAQEEDAAAVLRRVAEQEAQSCREARRMAREAAGEDGEGGDSSDEEEQQRKQSPEEKDNIKRRELAKELNELGVFLDEEGDLDAATRMLELKPKDWIEHRKSYNWGAAFIDPDCGTWILEASEHGEGADMLLKAVVDGDVVMTKILCNELKDPMTIVDGLGLTPAHLAAAYGQVGCLKVMPLSEDVLNKKAWNLWSLPKRKEFNLASMRSE